MVCKVLVYNNLFVDGELVVLKRLQTLTQEECVIGPTLGNISHSIGPILGTNFILAIGPVLGANVMSFCPLDQCWVPMSCPFVHWASVGPPKPRCPAIFKSIWPHSWPMFFFFSKDQYSHPTKSIKMLPVGPLLMNRSLGSSLTKCSPMSGSIVKALGY